MGARSQSGVTGLPFSVTPFNAAFILAVNIPRSSRMRDNPATPRNLGISKPAAPRNSQTPVTYTYCYHPPTLHANKLPNPKPNPISSPASATNASDFVQIPLSQVPRRNTLRAKPDRSAPAHLSIEP
jgi:hypothetical protein